MKAVILAAGRGKRLASMGWDKPKCLLEFGEKTLLDLAIESVLANHVDHVVVVVGFQEALVVEAAKRHPVRLDVIVNPDYEVTNTIHSLYLARDHLGDDFLYFNADVLFDRRIIARLLATSDSTLAIDEKACGEEEVKVIVDGDGRVIRIGKALPLADCMGEFIGVGKFSRAICLPLVASLRRYNEELGQRNLFFEAAVDAILVDCPVRAMPLGDLTVVEIDTPEDYAEAQRVWALSEFQG